MIYSDKLQSLMNLRGVIKLPRQAGQYILPICYVQTLLFI